MQRASLSEEWTEFKAWYVFLAIIILAGTAFRAYFIGYRALWICELYSVSYATLSMKELFTILQSGNQTPLYFVLLHYWVTLLGDSDAAVRLFSVFWGTVGLLGIFYLLRSSLGWSMRSALAGVVLLAVNPFHVYYSIEARHYSMYFAMSVFYLASFVQMHRRATLKTSIIFAIFQGLLLYTHPIALFYCITMNAVYLLLLFSFHNATRDKVKFFAIGSMLTAMLFLPWVITYLHQIKYTYKNFVWVAAPSITGAIKTWGSMTIFWSPEFVEWLSHSMVLHLIKPIIWICLICPVGILMVRGFLYVSKRECIPESFIILSLFTYPSVIYIISLLVKPMFLNRILMPSLIGSIVLILIFVEKSTSSATKKIGSVLVVLFFLTSICLTITMIKTDKSDDLRAIVPVIAQKAQKDDLVLFYRDYGASLFRRYYKAHLLVKGVAGEFEDEIKEWEFQEYDDGDKFERVNSSIVIKRVNQLVHKRERFFLVLFPVSEERIRAAEDFLFSLWHDYKIYETVTINQIKIYVLTRCSHSRS
jgi:uncharacterized membrane protein